MKKYESPVILENEDLAEGIYANSGANPSGSKNRSAGRYPSARNR